MRLFFFDTETTGTNPQVDYIIQFGGIFGTMDETTFEFKEEQRINQLINIRVKIPDGATAIHGIKNDDLKGFGYMDDYIYEFLSLIKKADYVVGHNIEFDKNMLIEETKRLGIPFDFSKVKWLDTMKPTTELVNGKGGKWPKLKDLHKFLFGCEFENAHDAMADIEATKNCFIELCKKYRIYDNVLSLTHGLDEETVRFKKLTNDQIDILFDFCGGDLIDFVDIFCTYDNFISLKWKSNTITDVQIVNLGFFRGDSVDLGYINELSNKQIQAAAMFRGEFLDLSGLKTITPWQARLLVKNFKGCFIDLSGLINISDEILEVLGHFKGDDILFSSHDEYDKWLDYHQRYINIRETSLNYYLIYKPYMQKVPDNLTHDHLLLLSNFGGYEGIIKKGWDYYVDGGFLTNITDKQAELLSKFRGDRLSLTKLTNITDKQAKLLSKFRGRCLDLGITSLTDKQAELLSKFRGDRLSLDKLSSITDEQVEYLSFFRGPNLYFENLKRSLTPWQREKLKGHNLYYGADYFYG